MSLKSTLKKLLAKRGLVLQRRPSRPYPYTRTFSFGAHTISFWIANELGYQWYGHSNPLEGQEAQQISKLLSPVESVLEIGAHHGLYSLYMSLLLQNSGGHLTALEADPFNAMVAQSQFPLNQLNPQNYRIMHGAGASASGELRFRQDLDSVATDDQQAANVVRAYTIDELQKDDPPYDMLKIDVEGYELEVLKGATQVLQSRPRICLELHYSMLAQFNASANQILDLIEPDHYEGLLSLSTGEMLAFNSDNVLAAEKNGIPKANLFLIPTGG